MAAAAEIKDTKKNCPKGQLGMYKYVYIYIHIYVKIYHFNVSMSYSTWTLL